MASLIKFSAIYKTFPVWTSFLKFFHDIKGTCKFMTFLIWCFSGAIVEVPNLNGRVWIVIKKNTLPICHEKIKENLISRFFLFHFIELDLMNTWQNLSYLVINKQATLPFSFAWPKYMTCKPFFHLTTIQDWNAQWRIKIVHKNIISSLIKRKTIADNIVDIT